MLTGSDYSDGVGLGGEVGVVAGGGEGSGFSVGLVGYVAFEVT